MHVAADQRGIWVAGHVVYNYCFVRRYDFAGSMIWERVFATSGTAVLGMSLDPGGVTVTGPTEGTFFPGVIEPAGGGTPDVYVRRYDPEGNHLWTRQFSSQGKYQDETRDIAADAGGLTVAGFTRGALPGFTNSGGNDAFLRRYTFDGTELWTRQFGTASYEDVYRITTMEDVIVVAGTTGGALPGQTHFGSYDAYARGYDRDGNELFTVQFGTEGDDEAVALAAGASGEFVVAGITKGGMGENAHLGGYDVFAVRFVPQDMDGVIEREAEDCELYGAFQVVNDPTASGGSFVQAPNGIGTRDLPDEAQKMVCRLSVPSGGTYRIKGVVRAPSPSYANNSFFVKVDGAPGTGYLWDIPESTRWATDEVSDRNGADPVGVVLAAGVHTVTVYLREDGAQIDKIRLEPTGTPPTNLAREAEACDIYGAFEIVDDPTASGGSFVAVPDYGGVWGSPNEAHKVVCQFSVAESGAYRIKGLVRAPSPAYGNNSFYVKIDGVPSAGYLWDTPESTRWMTDAVSERNGADPVEVSLSAGTHNVTIYLREDGTQLDKLELEPIGAMPGDLVSEAEDCELSGAFQIAADPAASEGSFVHAPQRRRHPGPAR